MNSKISSSARFLIQHQPLLTHLQISDALQEFLCVPDQLKLMHFDNRKLEMLTNQWVTNSDKLKQLLSRKAREKFLKKKKEDEIDDFDKETEFSPPKTVEEFANRIDSVVEVLVQEQKGSCRLNYSTDLNSPQFLVQQMTYDLEQKHKLIQKIFKFETQLKYATLEQA